MQIYGAATQHAYTFIIVKFIVFADGILASMGVILSILWYTLMIFYGIISWYFIVSQYGTKSGLSISS